MPPRSNPQSKPKIVLEEAIEIIRGARHADYGDAKDNHADIARGWEVILGLEPVEPWQVALCMDWLKTCRAINGEASLAARRDSLVDKAGYTEIAAHCLGIEDMYGDS